MRISQQLTVTQQQALQHRHSPEYFSARSASPATLRVHAMLSCDRQVVRRNIQRDVIWQIELRHVATEDAGIVGPGVWQVVVPGDHDAARVQNCYRAAIVTFHARGVNLLASRCQQAVSPVSQPLRSDA